MINTSEAIQKISARLSPRRLQHSLMVAQTARELAGDHCADADKAYLIGILHDYAKNLPAEELLAIAAAGELVGHEIEILLPGLLHAPVGAYLLARDLDIEDQEILQAVRVHTLGSTNMSVMDKIIFLADMIEPSRKIYPDLERLRQLCPRDLDQAMLLGLESTIRYCLERGTLLHPRTVEARNAFLLRIAG
ncbi:MAG: bis(5'-nucleosyl)-tetraphosphatase (symmetrical) YqeK [Firmicutes bacterium]|nr:bis(5'-nucleosyl)-tetraphosphatase (symmetrical) YqeK [Bacillota bacterium]